MGLKYKNYILYAGMRSNVYCKVKENRCLLQISFLFITLSAPQHFYYH